VPAQVWRLVTAERAEATATVGVVGVLIAAAAAAGAATDGRSAIYQVVLVGFGAHSVSHLGFSMLARGYTPGVVTAVLVVAPFSWWAWQRLSADGATGSLSTADAVIAVALLPVVLGSARLIGRRLASRLHRTAA
jgi:hypothetical protein